MIDGYSIKNQEHLSMQQHDVFVLIGVIFYHAFV